MQFADLLSQAAAPAGPERSGTQSLTRGIKLLRVIATRPGFGWRLSDLAAACGQDKGTVHRMLTCMVAERLVVQRQSDRHYLPGPLMFELGLALPERHQFQRHAEPVVEAFARRMAGIGVLMLRSGNEYVCTQRAGTLQLAGMMVYPGTRRPLFTSVGGIALLQTMPAQQARAVLLDNVTQEVARRGTGRLEALQKMRQRSDRHGFGVNLGDVVPGVHAFAVPVHGAGEAFAALCLMGASDQYGQQQIPQLRAELEATAGQLGELARKFNM